MVVSASHLAVPKKPAVKCHKVTYEMHRMLAVQWIARASCPRRMFSALRHSTALILNLDSWIFYHKPSTIHILSHLDQEARDSKKRRSSATPLYNQQTTSMPQEPTIWTTVSLESLRIRTTNVLNSIDEYTLLLLITATALALVGVLNFPDLRNIRAWSVRRALPFQLSTIGLPVIGLLAIQHGSGRVLGAYVLCISLLALTVNLPLIWEGLNHGSAASSTSENGEDERKKA